MADQDDESMTEEDLLSEHKKQRKDLQAHIQKLKRSVPKGDKKKKKEVTEEIAKLEAELDQRQDQELAAFQQKQKTESTVKSLENLSTEDLPEEGEGDVPFDKVKKSKAQKRREKKAAQAKEREERIREQEAENIFLARNVETEKIKKFLSERGLQIKEIASDGNCLYNAIVHQLSLKGIEASNEGLRQQIREYMQSHEVDFMPFLTKENGDCYSHEDFVQYCESLATTTAWGGQVEIQALSKVLKMSIEVVQAEGPLIRIGEECEGNPLIIIYHRHMYGLGEHYNSVQKKTEEGEDDFS
ncbi:hypothetical protein CHS0354_042835 [Potamilus streckersoni]|uniref:ubiquitinyl hydrolase 1 n=1 Tax=Potamilus streckersoni TaxID=2493646 RepID=A0AAE0T5N6_9BIVA|nr:hypothetical protein CHS0354_042835 [Potamilus streckersoni]